MRVLSWNVDGSFPTPGSPQAIKQCIKWLGSLDHRPDLLLLQEVNPNRQELWHDLLHTELGYASISDTLEQARTLDNSNGHITAVAQDWELSANNAESGRHDTPIDIDDRELAFPEKLLITDIGHPTGNIEVMNIRAVPGRDYGVEKLKLLEAAFDWVAASDERPRILAGDLNAPQEELVDGQAVTFRAHRDLDLRRRGMAAELNVLKGLGHFGMVDVFRAKHGYGDLDIRDSSHGQKRFDHIFASESLNPRDCQYLKHGPDCSDHNPIVADFDIQG